MKLLLLFALCAAASAVRNSTECTQCMEVVKYVEKKLDNNSTINEIEAFINKICEKLGSASEECESYVKQYVPEIVHMVAMKISPTAICDELHLCNKSNHVDMPTLVLEPGPVIIGGNGPGLGIPEDTDNEPAMPAAIELPEVLPMKAPQDETCILCVFILRELQSVLGSNATEQEIEQELDKVCNILPEAVRAPCTSFVNTNTPQLIQVLLEKLDPQQACTALHLCKNSSLVHEQIKRPHFEQREGRLGADPLCPICEQVLKYVDAMLAKNSTEQEIFQFVERVCQYLPQADQQQCKTYIEQYGEKIINMLVNKLSPQQVCTDLHLCSGQDKQLPIARHVNV